MNFKEGVLLVDKPGGVTSHDVVDEVRKKFGFKKVGHAGTLDPMATGLLILLLGAFTKMSEHFSAYGKEYEARLSLGVSRDTGDADGTITEEKDPALYEEGIKNIGKIFDSFRGEIRQIPPMYSAKKVKGKKLYELARKGIVLKREPKTVFIEDISITKTSLPEVAFFVKCSKGTYIRQLAVDIGEKVGCGAHLVFLRRTKIGPFGVDKAVTLEKLSEKTLYENILQP